MDFILVLATELSFLLAMPLPLIGQWAELRIGGGPNGQDIGSK